MPGDKSDSFKGPGDNTPYVPTWMQDEHAPFICPRSREVCVRAFCEDYGCADNAGVRIDANDIAAGSIDPDELIIPLPASVRRRR